MRDIFKELENLYQEVKNAGLEPIMVIKHYKQGTLEIIPADNDKFFVVSVEKKMAVPLSKKTVEVFLLSLLDEELMKIMDKLSEEML
jgi:predicted urease superfamily metal-dependent hydrolase